MVSEQALDLSHSRYKVQKSKFRQANEVLRNLNEKLHLSNDDEKFWWDATSGLLAALLAKAGYDEQLQTHFLQMFRSALPTLGPRPLADGKPCRYSRMSPDSTPMELSWAYDGAKSVVRLAFDPPDDALFQSSARTLLDEIAKSSKTEIDFELFDVISQAMGYASDKKPKDQCPSSFCIGLDLLNDGTVTVKTYFSLIDTWSEVRDQLVDGATPVPDPAQSIKSFPQAAGELVRLLDSKVYNSAPVLPAYKIIEEASQACAEHAKQTVCMVAWDCVKPLKSRLKVYVIKQCTSLRNFHDVWTLGGRLSGPEIDIGLEVLNELWRLLFCLDEIPIDEEVKDRDGNSQPILMYFEIKPGAKWPVPKIYLQPVDYGENDLDNIRKVANWFEKRGWPLGKTLVNDIQDIYSHQNLSKSSGMHTWFSISVQEGGDVKVVMYMSPSVYSTLGLAS